MWPNDVLSRFRPLVPCGRCGTWKSRCPSHHDRHPSLSLWLGRNGALVIRCWARRGCTLVSILQKVGLRMSDLFPPESRTDGPYAREGLRPASELPKPAVVETYDYLDERGEVLYQVCRTEPKGFFQRRYDASSGVWLNGLGASRRVLYRLPRIAASDVRMPVVVVEGERDVHALEGVGLLATTNPGGTGMGWRREYSDSLAGRRVVVIPDADEPGIKHALGVVGSLVQRGAASVRLVSLPGLEGGQDVRDYLEGHTREELLAVIRGAPEWRPVGHL